MREARGGGEAAFEDSLANCAYMDRLDKVEVIAGSNVRMEML